MGVTALVKTKWEILLAGSGGQGLGLAGKILGEAAIAERDYFVTHSQSYGARARGGFSQSSLVISAEEIVYPLLERADLLVALSEKGYSRFMSAVRDSGTIIYDDDSGIRPLGKVKEFGFPFFSEAEKIEHPRGVTLMALGAANFFLDIVSQESLEKAVENNFSGKMRELNLLACRRGREMAEGAGVL